LTEEPDVWKIRLSGSEEGPGNNRRYGWDVVAPPGNQAANREDKIQPIAMEGPGLLDNNDVASLRNLISFIFLNPL